MSSHLLTVDWDYFFPVPGPSAPVGEAMLYDWGFREAPFFIGPIWGSRTYGFLMNDLPLPTVNDEWRTFWDRFDIHDEAVLYVSDSHLIAGKSEVAYGGATFDWPVASVWSYDAHHDSGYNITMQAQVERWRNALPEEPTDA